MKLNIIAKDGKSTGDLELPTLFSEEYREDLIKKAVKVILANKRQPYGAKPGAGMRASADISRRRHKFKGSYGHGISRVPRKIMSARGTRFNWTGAFAPGTVGGRRAHAPKASKVWALNINKKEKRKAIRSAMAATLSKELVMQRNHVLPKEYPFIISNDFEKISKTKELKSVLDKLGLDKELKRVSKKTIRAGKGKNRGRPYNKKVGPLLVVGDNCELVKASRNIPGVETINVSKLNCSSLAPGAHPARLTLFTQNSIEKIKKEKLFV